MRGHKVRKQLPELMEEADRQQMIDKINQVEQRANRMDKAAITIQKRARGMNTRADVKQQTRAAATLQSAMRRKTDMMKKRQLVDEEQLNQMEETQRQIESAKADKAKKEDIAAKQLQAISKRIKAQNDVSKINKAKDRIDAAVKRSLTEKVKSAYIPKENKQ